MQGGETPPCVDVSILPVGVRQKALVWTLGMRLWIVAVSALSAAPSLNPSLRPWLRSH